ncbi:NADH dehydrogenase [ubiquinone] 1 alpha subcomplex subunit 10, mitochondrial [Strongyloides ratti]|uniref:NADH dehydrogenase [ubiquinone] 1 alpha subcomplex subunit 10, mitochondrial n=1 Tax=Strongyloides ratti TaxID=34506 RepID=A0A090LCQ0_STRRB|nr:NADH dehydrogenase [ubiquinone] 1 alpha subcomplex subunit 10, mitochondrial [Strongyloides ratti]CEF65265.1 NADH dehydrogenase [ubiquinone] 1 alpha subcomplex subunit 10, mitochondrial [Strongyloides ratti]
MLGSLRVIHGGVIRLVAPTSSMLKNMTSGQQILTSRNIVIKSHLDLPEDYPEPFPYKEKRLDFLTCMLDGTKKRFNQNSRLIVVEGNEGCEKSHVAKELADQFGMLYMPEFKMEDILIDRYKNDLRDYYHLFPKSFRIPDEQMFYKNPFSDLTAVMRERIFHCKFDQYLNALAHILNTGQGVVLEHTPHSDFVFINALKAKNYIGIEFFKHYYYLRKCGIPELNFWPHLVVYLDKPVQKCLENIKKSGNDDKIATIDEVYLKTIQDSYKDCLREYQKYSKILAYDWSNEGNTDIIVEDIERVDFDFHEWHSNEIFEQWFEPVDEAQWAIWRMHVTEKTKARVKAFSGISTHEVGELYINPRDAAHFINVMKREVLKSPYGYGYIKERGDKIHYKNITGFSHQLPEVWYDYYFKEAYYDKCITHESCIDHKAVHYDPDYLHHH